MSNEIRYFSDGEQATAEVLNRPTKDLGLKEQYMSKAEFESMVQMRRNAYAGSGLIHTNAKYSRLRYINDGGLAVWKNTDKYFTQTNDIVGLIGSNKIYLGDITATNDEHVLYNVNGNILKWYGAYNYFGAIKLPAPATSLGTITDSTSLGFDMKQGDFAILDDLNRELVENGTFDTGIDGWTGTNVSYDDTDKCLVSTFKNIYSTVAKRNGVYTVTGIEYMLTIDIINDDNAMLYMGIDQDTNRILKPTILSTGTHTFTFKGNGRYTSFGLKTNKSYDDDKTVKIKSISIKQVKEQPIVSLQDTEQGIDIYENSTLFEARDSISRQDLVFLETWHEDVSEKDIVYPYGNIQYRGTDRDGLSGIGEGTFDGYDTYSLFGEWQESSDLIGLGYKWSDLSNEDKLKFAGNKDNNIYKDGDNIIQVRYRVRVVKGIGNSAYNIDGTNVDYASGSPMFNSYFNRYIQVQGKNTIPDSYIDDDYSYLPANTPWTGQKRGHQIGCYAARNDNYGIERFDQTARMIPLAIFNRKNQGAYDPLYNPEGCGTFSDDKQWFETTDSHNNLIDCFNNAKNGDATVSAISGRPDGLFFDGVSGYDITDLRMDAKKIENIDTLLGTTYRKALNGDLRGNDAPFNMIKMETYSNTPMHLQHGIFGEKDSRIRIYTKEFANSRRTNIKSNDINIGNVISLYTSNGEYLSGKVIYKQNDNEYIDILVNDASDNINDCFVPYEFSTLHYKMADGIDLFAPIKKDYRYDKKAIHCEIIGKPSKYPDTWKTDGAPGKSIIYDDAQRSMKPIDRVVHTSSDTRYGDFRLSRMHNGNFEHMRVTKDAGETWYEITHGNASEAFKWEYNTTAVSFRYNTVRISFPKDWTDDIDNIVIEIIYNHTLSYIENDSIRKMISSDTTAYWHYKTHRGYYSHAVSENLLDKPVAISSYSNTPKVSININGIQNTNVFGGAHAITHDPFADMRHGSGDISDDFSVKAFPYITSKDYKARLSMLFREIVWDYDSTSEVYWDAGFISLGRDTADETTDIIIDGTEGEGGTGNDTYSILNGEDNGIKKYIDIKVAGKDLGGSISLSLQGSSDSDFEDYGDISEYIVFSVGTLRRYMVPIYDSFLNAIKFKGSIDAVYIEQVSVVKAGNSLPTEYRDGSWGDDLKFVYTNFVDIDNDDFDNEIVTGNKTIKLPYFIKD